MAVLGLVEHSCVLASLPCAHDSALEVQRKRADGFSLEAWSRKLRCLAGVACVRNGAQANDQCCTLQVLHLQVLERHVYGIKLCCSAASCRQNGLTALCSPSSAHFSGACRYDGAGARAPGHNCSVLLGRRRAAPGTAGWSRPLAQPPLC